MAIPQETYSRDPGSLTLRYGDDSITFRECAVDHSEVRIERGKQINMRILDRRWKWQSAIATYRANLPHRDASIRMDTVRTPAQIADFLFAILGETADTSEMPSSVYPYVEWDGVKVVDALDELCDHCGCVVVLGLDDAVRVKRLGSGGEIPAGALNLNELYPVQSAMQPANLQVRTGDLLVQSKLLLEAIAPEANETWDTIVNLAYRPTNGWGYESPRQFANVSATYTDNDFQTQYCSTLAFENMWRLYRVKQQAHGGLDVPGVPDAISSIEQITLHDTLNDFGLDMNSVRRPLPAYVEGIFWTGSDNYENTPAGTRCPVPFTIMPEGNAIKFSRPVVKLSADYLHDAATLYLTTTYTVRPFITSTPLRYQFTRSLDDTGRGTHGIERKDLTPAVTQRYANITALANRISNLGAIDNWANAQMEAVYQSFDQQPAQDAWYGGWLFRELDGAIAQTTWTMGEGRGTSTRMTRWNEHWPGPGGSHVW